MADELTVTTQLEYLDSAGTEFNALIDSFAATAATKKIMHHKQAIGTSEEAIVLGEVTSPGWALFVNRDDTNFIELRVATGGAKFAKLKPGETCLLRLGSGAQAPYAIADTAECLMEYWIAMT